MLPKEEEDMAVLPRDFNGVAGKQSKIRSDEAEVGMGKKYSEFVCIIYAAG